MALPFSSEAHNTRDICKTALKEVSSGCRHAPAEAGADEAAPNKPVLPKAGAAAAEPNDGVLAGAAYAEPNPCVLAGACAAPKLAKPVLAAAEDTCRRQGSQCQAPLHIASPPG